MWDYKVISGKYSLENGEVAIENSLGKGTLQRILDHYGSEGYELTSSNYDNINREIVLLLKRLKPGATLPVAAAPVSLSAPTSAPAAAGGDDDDLPPRRKKPASKGGRRSKAELDRLYRDT